MYLLSAEGSNPALRPPKQIRNAMVFTTARSGAPKVNTWPLVLDSIASSKDAK